MLAIATGGSAIASQAATVYAAGSIQLEAVVTGLGLPPQRILVRLRAFEALAQVAAILTRPDVLRASVALIRSIGASPGTFTLATTGPSVGALNLEPFARAGLTG
jgi:hypothetical protein